MWESGAWTLASPNCSNNNRVSDLGMCANCASMTQARNTIKKEKKKATTTRI
jgi:hypothetical protein